MKIKARSIELTRAEGFIDECVTVVVQQPLVWAQANVTLHRWSQTAPKDGSTYNKCDFKVTFEDGDTYDGRYDLKHFTVESPNLVRHIEAFCGCYAHRRRPGHMDDEDWARFTARTKDKADQFAKFLDEYQLGDEKFEDR